jgi:glutathione S-transferase
MESLIGLPYSPWTEKARWALDHHCVEYRFREYLPIFGIPLLRIRIGRYRGRVTVPVYLGAGAPLGDSFDIARFAESRGGGAPLFPAGREEEIAAWNRESEAALAAGRVLASGRIAADPQALRDSLPEMIPGPLRPALRSLTSLGIRYLMRKYQFDAARPEHEATLARVLDAAAAQLGSGRFLLGDFSYADICIAVVLQFVSPVDDAYIRLRPGARAGWATPSLAARHGRLIEWRDRLYREYRRPA